MPLKKPSQLFQEEKVFIRENYNPVVETFNETFNKFKDNVSVIESLRKKVDTLTEEINTKIAKSDLENAIFSHLIIVDENIKSIQNEVKGLNKKDLLTFKATTTNLTEIVDELKNHQFPKYKKKIVDTEVKISEKFENFVEEVNHNQKVAENNLQEKLSDFVDVIDSNFSIFSDTIQKTKSYVTETVNTYKNLQKIVESEVKKENTKLEEYSQVLENFNEKFVDFQESIQEQITDYEKVNKLLEENLTEWKNKAHNELDLFKKVIDEDVSSFKKETNNDVASLKADIVVYEKHNKSVLNQVDSLTEDISTFGKKLKEIKTLKESQDNLQKNINKTQVNLEVVEKYIQNHHNDIELLKEEVYEEIDRLPVGNIQENIERLEKKIDYIRETYSKVKPEVIVKEVIKEGFAEPPSTDNKDPLTPLDQNFVTLDQLQQHYRLFINRIQQQLSTLGGGGETRLKYLDDIVGIATNASAYDGKFLKYNDTLGKFEFTSVDITNDSWADGINGPYTNNSVGIGTSVANCELDVVGNVCVTGVVTATDFNSLSDLKLKENVEIIESPVDTVMKIEGVDFTWKETGKQSMGVIAQQLEENLPQLVSGEDIKTVNYNGLVGLLIEVVKDQQKQIDELRSRLDK